MSICLSVAQMFIYLLDMGKIINEILYISTWRLNKNVFCHQIVSFYYVLNIYFVHNSARALSRSIAHSSQITINFFLPISFNFFHLNQNVNYLNWKKKHDNRFIRCSHLPLKKIYWKKILKNFHSFQTNDKLISVFTTWKLFDESRKICDWISTNWKYLFKSNFLYRTQFHVIYVFDAVDLMSRRESSIDWTENWCSIQFYILNIVFVDAVSLSVK